MNGNQLTRTGRRPKLLRRISDALGPAGVFFKGFLQNPRMVGAVTASSKSTIVKMLAPVEWDNCRLFVEYGPGVGTFCQPVLDKLPRDGELVVIDTNPLFIDYLQRTIHDSRFHAVLGSAEDVEQIVGALGHKQADYVLSGMPISTLPEGVGETIAAATYRIIRPGGAFLTYQYSSTARNLTAAHFERVDTGLSLLNLPPCLLAWGWK